MNSYVVTTSVRGSSKTQIWEGRRPLTLGYPFLWVIERTVGGIRIRYLGTEVDRVQERAVREFTSEQIGTGADIEIAPYRLTIRLARKIAPAFESVARPKASSLTVYACAGNWLLESRTISRHYTGKIRGEAFFEIIEDTKGFCIRSLVDQLTIAGGRQAVLKKNETFSMSAEDFARSTVTHPNIPSLLWRFGWIQSQNFTDRRPRRSAIDREDEAGLKKAIQTTLIGLCVLMTIGWLWPKPKPEETIAPQVTALVLKPMQKTAQSSSDSGSPIQAKDAPKEQPKKDPAVAQAFRAKALKNAVNGLLKGGMTRLLAQSDFAAGTAGTAQARKIFDAAPSSVSDLSKIGVSQKNVQVASIGGNGNGGGSAVGYGKGERAGVSGQGHGFSPFVSVDSSGSSVDEGLTKDEVGEVIHRHLSEVRYCYESAMIHTPDLEGKLMTDFVIGGQGIVKSANVKSSTLPDPRLDDCIIRRLVTWKFPKPRGGVDVAVTYPFIFKTLGR